MTRRNEPLLPPIDDEPGPMPQLSAAEADAVAWAAVGCWAAQPPGLDPADDALGPSQPLTAAAAERLAHSAVRQHARRQRPGLAAWAQRAAAVALCLCGAMSIAFAAYRFWPALNEVANPAANGGKRSATHTEPRAPELSITPAAEPRGADAEQQASGKSNGAATPPSDPVNGHPPAAVSSRAPGISVDCDALLAQANALRAKRRWVAAEASYRQILAAGAATPQRYVALVAAAALAHEHLQKPARALALYESALALVPEGNLDEEARFGVAASQRALGNSLAEQHALEQLTAKHPNGLYTATAKRRLAELRDLSE